MTQDLCLTIFPQKLNEDEKFDFYISFLTGNWIRKLQNKWIAVGCPRIESHMKYIIKILTSSLANFVAQYQNPTQNYLYGHWF